MNALAWLARFAVFALWVPLVWALWCYDAVREALKKRRLGRDYEGPLED